MIWMNDSGEVSRATCHNNDALFPNSRQCIWTLLSKAITTTAAVKVAMCEANQVTHSLLSSLLKTSSVSGDHTNRVTPEETDIKTLA